MTQTPNPGGAETQGPDPSPAPNQADVEAAGVTPANEGANDDGGAPAGVEQGDNPTTSNAPTEDENS